MAGDTGILYSSPFKTYYYVGIQAYWGDVPLGATSVSVGFKIYFKSVNAAVTDSTNATYGNAQGNTWSAPSQSISFGSSGGVKEMSSRTWTIPISQTANTTVYMSAAFTGIEAMGGGECNTGTKSFVIGPSGVPYKHPTAAAGTYDFTPGSSKFTFSLSGGTSFSLTDVTALIYNDRRETTTPVSTYTQTYTTDNTTNKTYNFSLSDAIATQILEYWDASAHDTTRVGLRIKTHIATGDSIQTVYITPPSITASYSAASFSASRGDASGNDYTINQWYEAKINQISTCPFAQNNTYPNKILDLIFYNSNGDPISNSLIDATGNPLDATAVYDSSLDRLTVTKIDPAALATDTLYDVSAIFSNSYTTTTLVANILPTANNFIALKPGASVANHRIGIGTSAPAAMLDVNGHFRASNMVGMIAPFATPAAPEGWLLCNGAAVSRTTYYALYYALGGADSPFGQGNGSTTFNLPDLRGRIPLGLDNMGGTSANRVTATTADAIGGTGGHEALASHTHNVYNQNTTQYNVLAGSGFGLITSGGLTASSAAGTGNAGNLQPYLTINYCIKW